MTAFPRVGLAMAFAGAVALSACGGAASAAAARACGVAQAAARKTSTRSMNGPVMGSFATAFEGAGATGALAGPVRDAIADARDAQSDASAHDLAQYQADAELFMSDISEIERDCAHS
jgi:hypothetical protein